MKRIFSALAALAVGWGLCAPAHATNPYLFPLQQVPTVAQWVVAHHDGCFEISGTTTDFSCQFRWRDSFTADSLVLGVAWRPPSGTTTPPLTSVSFRDNPATCTLIPGTYTSDPTNGIAVSLYLCPNLAYPVSAFDLKFASAAELVLVQTTELYGCTSPCATEAGNATVTASANGPMSITTGSPTTAANDLVFSFAYGPNDAFSSPSGTLINNAGYGVSSFLMQDQIGATPGSYTNSLSTSAANANVLQAIAAFKQNSAPPVAAPALLGQQTFTVLDTQAAGSPVAGGLYAYAADYSLIFNPITLTTNPGSLLNFNSTAKAFTLARTVTSADDGTYSGELSVTQGGVTLNQPITLIVQPPRAYPAAATSNCDGPSTPPPAAARAGLTFRSYCFDPASPHYQTLSNWLDPIDNDTSPGYEWYSPWAAMTTRDFSFVPDPLGSGRTVAQFHWHSTDDINYMRSVNSSASYITAQTIQNNNQGTNGTVRFPVSNAYVEIRSATYPLLTDSFGANTPFAWFEWANCPAGVVDCGDPIKPEWALIEKDEVEFYGPRPGGGGSAFHFWNDKSFGYDANDAGLASTSEMPSVVPGWVPTGMYSYGTMTTTDAVSGIRTSSYVNDQLVPEIQSAIGRAMPGGTMNPYDLGVLPTWDPLGNDNRNVFPQYNYLVMWLGGTYGLNTPDCQTSNPSTSACVAEGGQPDQYTLIDHMEVWTCPEYLTDPTCPSRKGLAQ